MDELAISFPGWLVREKSPARGIDAKQAPQVGPSIGFAGLSYSVVTADIDEVGIRL